MSFRVTVGCTRAQGEAIAGADELFPATANPPVLVADEPHADRPDDWLIHAYFEHVPSADELSVVRGLGSGEPRIEELALAAGPDCFDAARELVDGDRAEPEAIEA